MTDVCGYVTMIGVDIRGCGVGDDYIALARARGGRVLQGEPRGRPINLDQLFPEIVPLSQLREQRREKHAAYNIAHAEEIRARRLARYARDRERQRACVGEQNVV